MTDINAMLDKQSEKNDEERGAEKWEPEEGDTLDGIILKTGWYDGGEYEPSMFFILKDMDGDTHRAYCPTVLKNQLLELQPAMGTGIAIRYEGRKESKNSSRKYHAYTLVPVPDKNGKVNIAIKTLTPNFKTFMVRIDGKRWANSKDTFTWQLHDGANKLEARSVNKWEVSGPVSTVEREVAK